MARSTISEDRVVAALTAAGQGQQGGAGLAELSMDELAAAAGVSRATLFRLFGSQQNLLRELGLEPSPTVRSRVLDTALDLVGRNGPAELSMDELAAAAGVSRATLYRLFPGKAALFAELVRIHSPFESIAGVLDAGRERPPAEVIPEVARAMARGMDGRLGLLLQMLFELARSEPETSSPPGMRTIPLVAGYLSEQMAAGRLRRTDPLVAFQALAGPIVMHLLTRPRAGSRAGAGSAESTELERVVDEFAGIWLRAMAPDGEGGTRRPRPRRSRDGHIDAGTHEPRRVRP